MDNLLREGRFEELYQEMKEVIHWDLRSVDKSDFLIVNYDNSVHMCGTYEEIFTANVQNKPVLLKLSGSRSGLSKWMLGRFPPSHMFDSWSSIYSYLNRVDSDKNWYNERTEVEKKRWLFDDGDHMLSDLELGKKYEGDFVIN